MNNYDPRLQSSSNTIIDFRDVMSMVYLWMIAGMAVTTAAAFATIQTGLVNANPILYIGAFFGEIALVFAITGMMSRASVSTLASMFVGYSALNGFTIAMILSYYDSSAAANAFLTTTLLFGAMSFVGYTTKLDLSGLGTYFLMAVIGLLVAMVVNMFIGNSTVDLAISMLGVLIFTGLTAYDTQKIKRMSERAQHAAIGTDMLVKLSIVGALMLYLDFINLFLFLLRLFGRNR